MDFSPCRMGKFPAVLRREIQPRMRKITKSNLDKLDRLSYTFKYIQLVYFRFLKGDLQCILRWKPTMRCGLSTV